MVARDGYVTAKGIVKSRNVAGRKSPSDALREEAERRWAESDRKAAKGRRRTQARAKRRGVSLAPNAEIERLRGKLAQAKRGRGRNAK
jgi:hypothetical protein